MKLKKYFKLSINPLWSFKLVLTKIEKLKDNQEKVP
jgi:hypothetical protein